VWTSLSFVKIQNAWYCHFRLTSLFDLLVSQYVKQETQITGEHGKEARATRLITERASRRIGQMAFKMALERPRKVFNHLLLSHLR